MKENTNQNLPDIPQYLVKNYEDLIDKIKNYQNYDIANALKMLKDIYDFIDKFNKFVKTFTNCSRGCSVCCNFLVETTYLEAIYIAKKTGSSINPNNKNEKNAIILTSGNIYHPCPFLSKKKDCSIYSYRPFNCRVYHTGSNAILCHEPYKTHAVYGDASKNYGVSFFIDLHSIIEKLNTNLNGNISDLRWFFFTKDFKDYLANLNSKRKQEIDDLGQTAKSSLF